MDAFPGMGLQGIAIPGVLQLANRQHVSVQAPVAVVHALPHLQCSRLSMFGQLLTKQRHVSEGTSPLDIHYKETHF